MSRVHVTIDRLVLKGFGAAERSALVEGLRGELARVLAEPQARDAWESSRVTPSLRLGRMPFEPGPSGGRKFGAGVARAIGKGLRP